jgi:hypothetical protein
LFSHFILWIFIVSVEKCKWFLYVYFVRFGESNTELKNVWVSHDGFNVCSGSVEVTLNHVDIYAHFSLCIYSPQLSCHLNKSDYRAIWERAELPNILGMISTRDIHELWGKPSLYLASAEVLMNLFLSFPHLCNQRIANCQGNCWGFCPLKNICFILF